MRTRRRGSSFAIALSFVLSQCASLQTSQKKIEEIQNTPKRFEAKRELIRPYDLSMESKKPQKTPFVAEYKRGPKTLLFLAAEHVPTGSLKEPLSHPTYQSVKELFQDYKIDAVIVEGVDPWPGFIPPASLRVKAERCEITQYRNEQCGESFFTMREALKKNRAVISGEPSSSEILSAIEAAGFQDVDLLGFYIVRAIPQWKRQGTFKTNIESAKFEEQIQRFRHRLSISSDFSFSDFEKWYKDRMKTSASYRSIATNDTAPHGGEDATFIQLLSHELGLVRDYSVVLRTAEALNEFNTVLVVYGGSHYITQEDALNDLMDGKAKILRSAKGSRSTAGSPKKRR
jgi:hypothetical protein